MYEKLIIKNIENLNLYELLKILKVYKYYLFKSTYKKTNTLKIKNEKINFKIKINNDIEIKINNKIIKSINFIKENDLKNLNENEKLLIKNFIINHLIENEFYNLIEKINNRKFLI